MALISVIVPIYNVESYLQEAVESLIHQQNSELEVILVDDGSTDLSGEIAENYAKQYYNIVCIHQENQGLSAARNTGIDYAHGEYVMFLDSDDYLVENSISQIQNEMSSGDYDLLLFSGKKVYQDTGETVFYGINEDTIYESGVDAYCQLRKKESYYTCVWFMVLRKQFLREHEIRFMDGILHEDHLFTFQVFMNAGRVRCFPWDVYRYRIRPSSIMTGAQKAGRRFEGFLACLCEMIRIGNMDKVDPEIFLRHEREIGIITAKYFIRMKRVECVDYKKQIENYICHVLKECRTIPICFRIGCYLKYLIIRAYLNKETSEA